MTEITIKVPDDIKELVGEIDEPIYIEAIKTVAKKKLDKRKKRLKELQKEKEKFVSKYSSNYNSFSKKVPDNKKAHDDWIEWTYIETTIKEIQSSVEKLEKLLGK